MSKKRYFLSVEENIDPTPTHTPTPDFDSTKRLYVNEYSFARALYTLPLTPGRKFDALCEDTPANLNYSTLNAIVQQIQVDGSTTATHSNWGISKLLVKKQYPNQPNITYNVDYLTGTQYTSGNSITAVCIYNVSKHNFQSNYYLDEYIQYIDSNRQIQNAYKYTPDTRSTGDPITAMMHSTIGYIGIELEPTEEVDYKPYFLIGKDATTQTTATLTNIQTLQTNRIYTSWTHYQAVTSQPWESWTTNTRKTHIAGATVGKDYTGILKYPVLEFNSGYFGEYNDKQFYFNYIILALPRNAVITDHHIFGGI